jgi:hypothetical protein
VKECIELDRDQLGHRDGRDANASANPNAVCNTYTYTRLFERVQFTNGTTQSSNTAETDGLPCNQLSEGGA